MYNIFKNYVEVKCNKKVYYKFMRKDQFENELPLLNNLFITKDFIIKYP